ncbi:Tom37 metaxin N-terminal-like domain-containing protein [Cystobacter fuscus]
MITLYQTPVAWGTPNLSPFCFKLEAYLRMVDLPYEVKLADLRYAPKGKAPYADIDGTIMGDSQFIIERLKKQYGDPLDSKLTPEQVAVGHAVRRMLEECTYWYIVYMRWVDEAGWLAYLPVAETMVPHVVGGRCRCRICARRCCRSSMTRARDATPWTRCRSWPRRTSSRSRRSWATSPTC